MSKQDHNEIWCECTNGHDVLVTEADLASGKCPKCGAPLKDEE